MGAPFPAITRLSSVPPDGRIDLSRSCLAGGVLSFLPKLESATRIMIRVGPARQAGCFTFASPKESNQRKGDPDIHSKPVPDGELRTAQARFCGVPHTAQ